MHIISSVANHRHLPSPLDVMLKGFIRSLMKTGDLGPPNLQSAVIKHPISANQSTLNSIRPFYPIALQTMDSSRTRGPQWLWIKAT